MSKPFRVLYDAMPAASRKRVEKRVEKAKKAMALQEVRQARALTQQQLAKTLHLNQAAISKVERQSDMYVSTLRRFLEAMGAELKIVAHFPDRDVVIKQFGDRS